MKNIFTTVTVFMLGGVFTYLAGTIYHKYECLNPKYEEVSHLQVVHAECMELQSLAVCNNRLGVEQ